ncbi:MAG: N-acetylmuramoyl-L-alanine amidase [Planctomycetes bacterium]|nr:N-acetylmuramoyl-L-alanine amidase [Planctomycetota bacterium]
MTLVPRTSARAAALALALAASACGSSGRTPAPAPPTSTPAAPRPDAPAAPALPGHADEPAPARVGTAIIVGGRRVEVGAPVVTWEDAGGHDAHREKCAFSDAVLPSSPAAGCDTPRRYAARDIDAAKVDLVVVHYDVAWTSRNCFRILHDVRGLSCHFLLDVDGTIYQTLDLALRARHAGGVNDRSVGIEIAHPGPLELTAGLADRYARDEATGAVRFDLGARSGDVRTDDFVVRPSRAEPVAGPIHGRTYTMYDFTDAQYDALARLLAALDRAFPDLRLEAPRGPDGAVTTTVADPATFGAAAGVGVIGHYHVTRAKQDPGPAFDWERVLAAARAAGE